MSQTSLSNLDTRILFIVGPTASGKSDLAMKLAEKFGGELICADSQTVRRDLTIGTAKPTDEDRRRVPHHLLDKIGPYDSYNVASFQRDAKDAIEAILSRGRLPIVVGGTGLYIDALFYDYSLQPQAVDRRELESKTVEQLQEIILSNGWQLPTNAQNPRHLIGAISRGGTYAEDTLPIAGARIYGVLQPDDELKRRIASRIDVMFDQGFVDEVEHLIATYGRPPMKMDAIGYPIVMRYIDGEISIDTAKELFKRGDWQYARRQKAWLKRNEHIQWLDPVTAYSVIEKELLDS